MKLTSAPLTGTLYIVATPIGNLEDISARALKILQSVDIILAEDTRNSLVLLNAFGIKKPVRSFHVHNENKQTSEILSQLQQGVSFALLSDAGTPLISDPGFSIVREAHTHHIPVCPLPGPCALITALSAAGVPCDIFTFAGFLPATVSARQEKLQTMRALHHTVVFYESPHRLLKCIEDIENIFGEHYEWVLAKELTKIFERFISGASKDIKAWLLLDKGHQKGEFVLILPARPIEVENHEHTLRILLNELPLKQAVKIACKLTGVHKNELYKTALTLSDH